MEPASAAAPPAPVNFNEGSSINTNTRDNNNIVWKNVNIINPGQGENVGQIIVRGVEPKEETAKLRFFFNEQGQQFFKYGGHIFLTLEQGLWESWVAGGSKGGNVSPVADKKYTLELLDSEAYIENFALKYREEFRVLVEFDYSHRRFLPYPMFHVAQSSGASFENLNGGVSYQLQSRRPTIIPSILSFLLGTEIK